MIICIPSCYGHRSLTLSHSHTHTRTHTGTQNLWNTILHQLVQFPPTALTPFCFQPRLINLTAANLPKYHQDQQNRNKCLTGFGPRYSHLCSLTAKLFQRKSHQLKPLSSSVKTFVLKQTMLELWETKQRKKRKEKNFPTACINMNTRLKIGTNV